MYIPSSTKSKATTARPPQGVDASSLLKQEHVSGAKSLTHTPALPALAGMSFVHKRHTETRLLAPHWHSGGAACGEGVGGGGGEAFPPIQNGIKLMETEGGGTKEEILVMIQKTVTPKNRLFIKEKEGYLNVELLQKGDKKDILFNELVLSCNFLIENKETLVIVLTDNLKGGGASGKPIDVWVKDEFTQKGNKSVLPYKDNIDDEDSLSYILPPIVATYEGGATVGLFNDKTDPYSSQYARLTVLFEGKNKSILENARFSVCVHSRLNLSGRVEAFAHEFYSHFGFLRKGNKKYGHIINRKRERNPELVKWEKPIIKQAYENYIIK